MTSTDTVLERPSAEGLADVDAATPAQATGTRAATLALGLWAVVGSLLAYGVLQTVLKASALFG